MPHVAERWAVEGCSRKVAMGSRVIFTPSPVGFLLKFSMEKMENMVRAGPSLVITVTSTHQ